MTQNINQVPSEPSLSDLWQYWKKQLKLEFQCHHVGTIQSFNPVTQTAQATINYAKTFLQISGVGASSITTSDYPVLVDCPCLVLGGGGGALTFPISDGDECLIVFNDRDLDNWFAGSSSAAPATGRLHAFSDAIVLVGLRSLANVIVEYDTDAVALTYEGNKIRIYEDKVNVTLGLTETVNLELTAAGKFAVTNETGELLAALVQLFNDVNTATAGGFPVLMPTFAVDILTLQSFTE